MSRDFDYRAATPVQVAQHLNTVQLQAFSRVRKYYKEKGDEHMVAKLEWAKLYSRVLETLDKLKDFERENAALLEGGA